MRIIIAVWKAIKQIKHTRSKQSFEYKMQLLTNERLVL